MHSHPASRALFHAFLLLISSFFCISARAGCLENTLQRAYDTNVSLVEGRKALAAQQPGAPDTLADLRPSLHPDTPNPNTQPWANNPTETRAIRIDQPLFNGGKEAATTRSALARAKAARARLLALEQRVLLDALEKLLAVAEATRLHALNESRAELARNTLQTLRARKAPKAQLAAAEAQLQSAVAARQSGQQALERTRAAYKAALGTAPPGHCALPPPPANLPATALEAARLAEQSPELLQLRSAENAAASALDQRLAAQMPDLSVRGTLRSEEGMAAPAVKDYRENSIMLNLSIPFSHAEANRARPEGSTTEYQRAKFDAEAAARNVKEAAMRSWQEYSDAVQVLTDSEKTASAASAAVDALKKSPAGPLRDTGRFEAQQALLNARSRQVQAQALVQRSAYRLLAATGQCTAAHFQLKATQPSY